MLRAILENSEPLWSLYYKRLLGILKEPFSKLMEFAEEIPGFSSEEAVRGIAKAAAIPHGKVKTPGDILAYLEGRTDEEKYKLILPSVISCTEKIAQTPTIVNKILHLLENPPGTVIEVPRLKLYVGSTLFRWPEMIKALAREAGDNPSDIHLLIMKDIPEEEQGSAFGKEEKEFPMFQKLVYRYNLNVTHLLQAQGIDVMNTSSFKGRHLN